MHLEQTQRLMAARLRASLAGHLGEPAWKILLKRLEQFPEFREHWRRYEVVGTRSKVKEFLNPHVVSSPWNTPTCGSAPSWARAW